MKTTKRSIILSIAMALASIVSCGEKEEPAPSGPELYFSYPSMSVEYGVRKPCELMSRANPSDAFEDYDFKTDKLKVKFKYEPEGVVAVDGDGMLVVSSAGSSTVTAFLSGGVSASMEVTAAVPPFELAFAEAGVSVVEGRSVPCGLGSRKNPKDVFAPYDFAGDLLKLEFKFAEDGIASIDNEGNIQGLKAGETTLTVTAFNGAAASLKVTVDKYIPKLKVMSFNILQATNEQAGHEWANIRRRPTVSMINSISPDIICIQEARKTQCQDLANMLPKYAQVKFPKDGIESNGGQRNLIMYKADEFDLVKWDKYWFSEDLTANGGRWGDASTTQKMTVYVQLRHKESGKMVWAFDVHFFASCQYATTWAKCPEISLEQVKKIVPAGDIVFFCGDFNMLPTNGNLTQLYAYLNNACQYAEDSDGFGRRTFNGFAYTSTSVIDNILYRNAVCKTYRVVDDPKAYGTEFLSDHYPIYSDFELTADE